MQRRENGSQEVTSVCDERMRVFLPLALRPIPAYFFGYVEQRLVAGSLLAWTHPLTTHLPPHPSPLPSVRA